MEELRFDGRVAVVTGAGGGLGRQHALELARRGASVVVNDLGSSLTGEGADSSPAQRVVQEIEDEGGIAVTDAHDVSSAEGGAAIVERALEVFGRVDIVVNNAGITDGASFHKLTPSMVDRVIDVHLKGAFFVTMPAWRHMRDQRYGRVVHTTSSTGILGTFGHMNYLSAKTGLWGLTRGLAVEGAGHGILVNAIAPWARSRMTKTSDQARERRTDQEDEVVRLGRQVQLVPELVSPLVAYLCHDRCATTGHVYSVGGGRVARYFIGLTDGIFDPALTAESIADRMGEVDDTSSFSQPVNPEAELASLVEVANAFEVS